MLVLVVSVVSVVSGSLYVFGMWTMWTCLFGTLDRVSLPTVLVMR